VNLVTIIGFSVFFMFQRSPELTVYVLLPLPILAIIIYIVNQRIHKQSEVIQESLSALTTNAQESYAGIRVIKSFTQENTMLRFFTQNSEKYRQSAVGLAKIEALYFPSITLLIGLSTLLTIMIGGLYYINGTHNIGPGTIVEFVIYVNMLTFPVSAIGLTASMIQRAAASQKRLNEFLDIKPAIVDEPLARDVPLYGDIIFNNVLLRYPDTGIQALKHFNLHIRAGEKIAIFGRTGSGKTTLAQLLLRMYDPQEGHISIDGIDLREIKLGSLRRQISYVPQDVFLFSDTIYNNIASGETDVTEEQVYEAARQAGVHEEILRFPQQYQTIVGERGVTLSGGQKQRVSIARAIIKNPHILLFDDCLSAVDAKTESLITGHLNTYLQNKTAIIITHRIFASLEFDKIFVLDEGVVIEQGTHEELLQLPNGYYAALYQQQKKG
jgi:ATP-binding cassette subfamily B multidrug efflux pump